MSRFGIATLFEHVPDGYEFTNSEIPLHLTHVDVCEVDMEPAVFVTVLRNYLSSVEAFEIVPTEDAFLGPAADIPVTRIAQTPELMAFHVGLMDFLRGCGALFDNPQYSGDNYLPHITMQGARRVPLNHTLSVSSVSIGNKRTDVDSPPNRIIATIALS